MEGCRSIVRNGTILHLLSTWGKNAKFGVPMDEPLSSQCTRDVKETPFQMPACSPGDWQLHPSAAPWFGWGTGFAIPRKCLPPVQAGIPAHTPAAGGRRVDGMLPLCRSRRSGTTWGLRPSPPGCISAQSSAPCMAASLLLAVWGHESALTAC